MGGTTFEQVGYGRSVQEVFQALRDDATFEYGHDPYNGTISTTSLGKEINLDLYPKLKKALIKNDWKVLEEFDSVLYPSKWNSNYVKEFAYYQAFTPEWVSDKETPPRKKGAKMIKKYSVLTEEKFYNNSVSFTEYDTLSDAKKAAKKLALIEGKNVVVYQYRQNENFRKEKVKLGVMKLKTDGKQYKSKRTSRTKVYLATYKYTFFVYAAC